MNRIACCHRLGLRRLEFLKLNDDTIQKLHRWKVFLCVESLKLNDYFLPPVAASAALHLGHLLIDKLTIVIVTSLNENEQPRVTLTPPSRYVPFELLHSIPFSLRTDCHGNRWSP